MQVKCRENAFSTCLKKFSTWCKYLIVNAAVEMQGMQGKNNFVEEFADYDKIPIKNNGVFRFAYDRICRVIRMNMKGLEKRTIKYRLHPF